MAYYRIPLKAGAEHVQYIAGSVILVDGIDGAAGVDVTPILNNSPQVTMPARKPGFKYRTNYDAVTLRAAADCEVGIFLTTNDVSLGFTDGAQVMVAGGVSILNAQDQRVPVDLEGGTVNVNAANVGINNTDAAPVPIRMPAGAFLPSKSYKAQAVTNVEPVNMAANAQAIVAADPNRRGVRLRNVGGSAVAIGGAGVIFAKSVILIQPGETWAESEAASAAWYGICDADQNSILNIQVIA